MIFSCETFQVPVSCKYKKGDKSKMPCFFTSRLEYFSLHKVNVGQQRGKYYLNFNKETKMIFKSQQSKMTAYSPWCLCDMMDRE